MNQSIKFCLERMIDVIYPRRCAVCDRPVRPFGKLVCDCCKDRFEYLQEATCMKCGKALHDKEEEYCKDCKRIKHMYDRGFSVFTYDSVYQSVYRFKYEGRQEYARYYAKQIADRYRETFQKIGVQAIVPVPIHRRRKIKRGYNQAEVLAEELGKLLDIPVEKQLVKRVRNTAALKNLSPMERQNNLKKAFKIRCNDVKLNTIVIIDDIYTTGSTVDAVSEVCKNAGIRKIYVLTLASGQGQ